MRINILRNDFDVISQELVRYNAKVESERFFLGVFLLLNPFSLARYLVFSELIFSRDPHCQEQERASAFHPYVI